MSIFFNAKPTPKIRGIIIVYPDVDVGMPHSVYVMGIIKQNFGSLLAEADHIEGEFRSAIEANFNGEWSGFHEAMEATEPGDHLILNVLTPLPLPDPVTWIEYMSRHNGLAFKYELSYIIYDTRNCSITCLGTAVKVEV